MKITKFIEKQNIYKYLYQNFCQTKTKNIKFEFSFNFRTLTLVHTHSHSHLTNLIFLAIRNGKNLREIRET